VNKKEKKLKSNACCVFGVLCRSPSAGKGRGEEAEPGPSIFQRFSRRRVGEPTRRHCSSNVHTGPEGFAALLWIFGVCFVILKVFNGIFVSF
jgi:hypothetical protein